MKTPFSNCGVTSGLAVWSTVASTTAYNKGHFYLCPASWETVVALIVSCHYLWGIFAPCASCLHLFQIFSICHNMDSKQSLCYLWSQRHTPQDVCAKSENNSHWHVCTSCTYLVTTELQSILEIQLMRSTWRIETIKSCLNLAKQWYTHQTKHSIDLCENSYIWIMWCQNNELLMLRAQET